MSRHFTSTQCEQIATRLEQTLRWCAQRPIYLSPSEELHNWYASERWRSPLLAPRLFSQIATRLKQTLRWGAQRPVYLSPPEPPSDPSTPDPWRSPLLAPRLLSQEPRLTPLNDLSLEQTEEAVEESCRRRADWLNANPHPQDVRWRGTLLAYAIHTSDQCGQTPNADYFYDESDGPAWDSWLGLFQTAFAPDTSRLWLLYWAPEAAMPLLQEAIDVMPAAYHRAVLDIELERFINERLSQRALPPIDWMSEHDLSERVRDE